MSKDKPANKINRRQLVRTAVAVCAAATVTAAAESAETTVQTATPVQAKDTHVNVIEQSLSRKLTADQRKILASNIASNDKAWTETRAKYSVPDQTEPGVLFRPHGEIKHGK